MPAPFQGNRVRDMLTGVAMVMGIFTLSVIAPMAGILGLLTSLMGALVMPLPVLFYRMKLGRGPGLVVPLAALAIITLIAGRPSVDLLILAQILFSGYLLGEMLEGGTSIEKAIGGTVAIVLLGGLLVGVIGGLIEGSGLFGLLNRYVAANLELSLSIYQRVGMPPEHLARFTAEMEHIRYWIVRRIPGFAVAAQLFITWVTFLLGRSLLASKGVYLAPFGALNRWQAPEILVWGVIGAGLMLLLPVETLSLAGVNLMMVLALIYFFQGIAVCSFYFERKKFPRPLKFFLYSLMALQLLLLILVIGLGFFDMWLNFRKLGVSGEAA